MPIGPCAKLHASPRLHPIAVAAYRQKRWRESVGGSSGTCVAARSTVMSGTVAAAARLRARLLWLWTWVSIARVADTAAGACGAAGDEVAIGLRLGRVECDVAGCANVQLSPNLHHPVFWNDVHNAAGAGRIGAGAGALWDLRLVRRDAV